MKPLYLTTMFGFTALLAACGEKPDTGATKNAATESGAMNGMANGDMGNMPMATNMAPGMARGTGTVTEIDKAVGTITLDHGPIAEANWPAMTMAFKARPELLDSVKVGDKVAFDLALKDGTGEVTAIRKQ